MNLTTYTDLFSLAFCSSDDQAAFSADVVAAVYESLDYLMVDFSEKNTRMMFDDKSTDPPHLLLPLIRSSVSLLSIRGYSPSFASLVLIPDAEVGLVVVRVLLIAVLVFLVVIVVVPQGGDGSGRVGG